MDTTNEGQGETLPTVRADSVIMDKRSLKGKGRDSKGRFLKGEWKGGPGNPMVRQTETLRAALASAVTRADIIDIAHGLISKAKAKDVQAIHELFDRLFGKANQPIDVADHGAASVQIAIVANLLRNPVDLAAANALARRLQASEEGSSRP